MSEADETQVDAPVPTELWTPPEKLSPNIGKMAWAMFLESWKAALARNAGPEFDTTLVYEDCIQRAREIEDVNANPPKRPE